VYSHLASGLAFGIAARTPCGVRKHAELGVEQGKTDGGQHRKQPVPLVYRLHGRDGHPLLLAVSFRMRGSPAYSFRSPCRRQEAAGTPNHFMRKPLRCQSEF